MEVMGQKYEWLASGWAKKGFDMYEGEKTIEAEVECTMLS
jgi:hypothetical protein